jgi:pSer/pThr/pTyr-binding forkhead associated (FHA) protein
MYKSWTIGSADDCELIVVQPTVSGHHCRLLELNGTFLLEDLGSTNGTFVNGKRLTERLAVRRGDAITLGQGTPFPWPADTSPSKLAYLIGRDPENDYVIDGPGVSGNHAMVTLGWVPGEAVIEDLGSTNGTALGSPDRRIRREILNVGDTVYFGKHAVAASQILGRLGNTAAPSLEFTGVEMVLGRDERCDRAFDAPQVSGRHARLFRAQGGLMIEDLHSSNGTYVNGRRIQKSASLRSGDRIGLGSFTLVVFIPSTQPVPASEDAPTIAQSPSPVRESARKVAASPLPERRHVAAWVWAILIVEAPLIALVIIVGLKLSAPPEARAAALAWLSAAAVGFGISQGIQGRRLLEPPANWMWLGVAAALCVYQCGIAWVLVALGLGLKAGGAASIGVLILAAGVGLGLCVVLRTVSGRLDVNAVVLVGALLYVTLLGGATSPFLVATSSREAVSTLSPSRWAYEALLQRELDAEGRELTAGLLREQPAGTRASVLALGFMLVGTAVATALITWSRSPVPPRLSSVPAAPAG